MSHQWWKMFLHQLSLAILLKMFSTFRKLFAKPIYLVSLFFSNKTQDEGAERGAPLSRLKIKYLLCKFKRCHSNLFGFWITKVRVVDITLRHLTTFWPLCRYLNLSLKRWRPKGAPSIRVFVFTEFLVLTCNLCVRHHWFS